MLLLILFETVCRYLLSTLLEDKELPFMHSSHNNTPCTFTNIFKNMHFAAISDPLRDTLCYTNTDIQ